MTIILGPHWQHELRASRYWLRFALSRGGSYVTMFTSAYDRARCLARAALVSEAPMAVIAANPNPSDEVGAKRHRWRGRTAYDVLHKMGVPTIPCEASWMGYVDPHAQEDPEAVLWEHRAVRVSWDQADIVLWSNIAYDIGVAPVAPVRSTLVDVERGVTVCAYDDRGMDIIALDRDSIGQLYSRFDAWLLEYDRPRMSDTFAARA